ncbi:DUF2804 family protein [Paeniglutamicibacter psychrophenolicus]|uniref:DUF2804 family protein n=1 Tax=Paeniglutamicibacter psychrophenolicus TaxID=257454 RepID=UPI0035931DE3
MHRIGEELDWHYDTADWLAPWRISGQNVELEFTPFGDRTSRTELLLVASRGHQCLGHFTGSVLVEERRVRIDGLLGWAEQMRNRWWDTSPRKELQRPGTAWSKPGPGPGNPAP